MIEILKNMFRRKTRTLLTVFGIAIGIFALVVMGAMAEKISLLVDGGVKYYGDKVQISPDVAGFGFTPMRIQDKAPIEKVDGVAYVAPMVYTTLKKTVDSVNFGPPDAISGGDLNSLKYESFKLTMAEGRRIQEGDSGVVTLGSDLVKKLNAKLGQDVEIRGKKYKVVGIYNKTFTAPDNTVSMSMSDAQKIVYDDLPPIVKLAVKPSEVTSGFIVYPASGVNPNDLAVKIQKEVKGVKAAGPKAFQDQVASATQIFTSIIYGIALISLLVGSLSVINTMTMSISERTKEIGIKKALGAKTRNIMGEYLTEAGIIGFLGGMIGLTLGVLTTITLNAIMEKTSQPLFLLTNRLMIGSVLFSISLGVIAGIYPAIHATRLSIVKSLREE